MMLPIVAYGHPVLRKRSEEIDEDFEGLDELIENMFDTMVKTNGVGLAAPQINRNIRVFVIDTVLAEEDPKNAFREVFLNPEILDFDGDEYYFNEGCLSVPDIHEDVLRPEKVLIRYYDRNWSLHEKWFEGYPARVIQHEYDHIEGKTFVDRLSPIKKMLLKGRLKDISTGRVNPGYKMIFPFQKKGTR